MKPSELITKSRNFFTKVKSIMYIFITTLFLLISVMIYASIGTLTIIIITIIFMLLNLMILIQADKEIKNIDDFLIKHLLNKIREDERKKNKKQRQV